MNEFYLYLKMGLDHILDLNGLDHILFVITLCAIYNLKEYKKVLILVTAFTIGHSLTLALSALEVLSINSTVVEILIPVTILLTAIYNINFYNKSLKTTIYINYLMALFYGLIHGLGFSNFFKAMMMGQDQIVFPLFSFNLGIEIGQLFIVLLLLVILYIYTRLLKKEHYSWNLVLSGAGAGIALTMILERILITF
ncbi:HupE/UreJ family protein [Pseudofulvibacter geojedonensis]|uniref:HupE/UreJ family protein n=1 Tax=Pseudofulvibacter geojedonensis TaxID=1123758 RepID=A0ABW3I0G8_9FLAO